ncbi:hypothetical protein M432DRAFT_597819 [Thermoascus aurantiacus ATCC 26904]
MRLSLRQCLLALLSTTTHWHSAIAAGAQYCQKEAPEFCVAVSSRQNATTQATDLFLSIATKPSTDEKGGGVKGWTSVGIGERMAGALMFILYADASREQVTVSVRTADGHVMPTAVAVVETAPEISIDVLNATVLSGRGGGTRDYYYFADIACYSCDQWPALDIRSKQQPWIYAANADQVFQQGRAESDASLDMHQTHGHLAVDMPSTLLKDDDPVPSVDIINRKRESFGAWSVKTGHGHKSWPTAIQLHGLIMTACFMGIFVFGTIMIRWPHARSFRLHWIAQLTASLLAIGSAAYMLSRARHLGPHKTIGLVTTSLLILQGWLGYKHHVVFVRSRRQSVFTTLHLWLGRSVLCLGIFNVGTGMFYAGWSAVALAVWFIVVVAEVIGYLYVSYRHRRRKLQEKNNKNMNDLREENEEGIEGVPLMERVA